MPEKRRGLGRGLGALIPSSAEQQGETASSASTRVAERGRPVDLFFPTAASHGVDGEGQAESRSASSSSPTNRSSINKAALTAPSQRTNGRSQATSKKTSSPKSRKPKAEDPANVTSGQSADGVVKESPLSQKPATQPEAADLEGSVAIGIPTDGTEDAETDRTEQSEGEVDSEVADPDPVSESAVDVSRETLQEVPGARFAELPIGSIHPNRKQPRTVFDEDEMAELVHSVREIGVLQPVVVRESSEGGEQGYELVMGERRWRASKEAGLDTVPAIIRDTTDDDLLRDALLENLHRSQLNALEEAAAYQQLLDDFGCSQEELAVRIGRSRPQISNTLRLMKLPPLVQRRLAAGVLSAGHARALLGLADPAEMEKLAQRIVAEGLSVRSTEEIVAMSDGLRRPSKPATPRAGARHERLDYLATSLSDRLDTNVKITLGAKKGRVSIEFASVDDLNRIMGVLASTS